jgi:hypothetical protein
MLPKLVASILKEAKPLKWKKVKSSEANYQTWQSTDGQAQAILDLKAHALTIVSKEANEILKKGGKESL